MSENNNKNYTFKVSMTVLQHLGRGLYRNFATVLGEAISNSWDADANNIHIYIDGKNIIIKDDGHGMTPDDFQNKFLKVGYSKRTDGEHRSNKNRPYIGRKGVGKLSFMAAANKIHIISKTKESNEYTGTLIDNKEIDNAIVKDANTDEHSLGNPNMDLFSKYTDNHNHGTIIAFEELIGKRGHSEEHIRKIIALYFKFSLIDNNFNIYVNDKIVNHKDLDFISKNTQFCWTIGELNDSFIKHVKPVKVGNLENFKEVCKENNIKLFIASVAKPSNLSIHGAGGEKITLDIYVNGRVREINVLSKITSHQVPESYMYGQIHLDDLDNDNSDRFTTSREGIIDNDELYNEKLEVIKQILSKVILDWSDFRNKINESVDTDDKDLAKELEKKMINVLNGIAKRIEGDNERNIFSKNKTLKESIAKYAVAYTECYIVENLMKQYILDNKIDVTKHADAHKEIKKFRNVEKKRIKELDICYKIRPDEDIEYLSSISMYKIIQEEGKEEGILNKASIAIDEYNLVRNPLMHTASLTKEAFSQLNLSIRNLENYILNKIKNNSN